MYCRKCLASSLPKMLQKNWATKVSLQRLLRPILLVFAAGLALEVVGAMYSLGRARTSRNGQYAPVSSICMRIDHDDEELPGPEDCLGTLGGGGKRHSSDKPRFSRQINGLANPSGSNASSQHRLHSKRHWQKWFLYNVTDTIQVYSKGNCEVLVLDVLFQDYICIHLCRIFLNWFPA